MRSWSEEGFGAVLAVIVSATTAQAGPTLGSSTWVATETTVEATPTTEIYLWSFLGTTDFTLTNTYSFFSPGFLGFDFQLSNEVFSAPPPGILGIPFPDDGTVLDALRILTGSENFFRSGCSLSNFPPCELGVVVVFSETIDWAVIPGQEANWK